ncbi:MAG: sigma 54-interacting transcriptional regulator [Candidatus Binataceae bacterium]|nr:sigma 54-interacting transcriptional regulator [Candidatus Binataceae bacterium]
MLIAAALMVRRGTLRSRAAWISGNARRVPGYRRGARAAGNLQRYDGQPVIQIVAEVAFACPLLEIATSGLGTNATVLITGETGTGKELVARAVHHSSDRAPAGAIEPGAERHRRVPRRRLG